MSKTLKGIGELGTKSGQMPFSKVMSQAGLKCSSCPSLRLGNGYSSCRLSYSCSNNRPFLGTSEFTHTEDVQSCSLVMKWYFEQQLDPVIWGFPGWTVVKNPSASARGARDPSLTPELGKSSGVGNGKPLQYSCLGSPMDRGAWWARVHGVTESPTRLSTHQLFIYQMD